MQKQGKRAKVSRVEEAVEEYRAGKVSLSKASEIAGTNLWTFLEDMEGRGLQINYGEAELKEDMEAALTNPAEAQKPSAQISGH